jgi:hypothetical protein
MCRVLQQCKRRTTNNRLELALVATLKGAVELELALVVTLKGAVEAAAPPLKTILREQTTTDAKQKRLHAFQDNPL